MTGVDSVGPWGRCDSPPPRAEFLKAFSVVFFFFFLAYKKAPRCKQAKFNALYPNKIHVPESSFGF